MTKKTVVIGMSGGVDSSVAAYLLKQQGYDVISLFMKNWEDDDTKSFCSSQKDYEDVLSTCQQLDIPCYSVSFAKEYKQLVFKHFLTSYEMGHTPNPDILCNKEIKFKLFFEKALSLGADFMATGHYCITKNGKLFKGVDETKDQSYFLYSLKGCVLEKVLFPLGKLKKKKVKEIAKEQNLIAATKKESMGICFIGKKDFRPFLSRYLKKNEGPLMTLDGKVVGSHMGTSFYTLGQRKGLSIGGEGDAWFVVKKDRDKNIIYVAQGKSHPALFFDEIIATDITFVDEKIDTFPFVCSAKVRYRQEEQKCIVEKKDDKLLITFEKPQRAPTPGQSIVFYKENECLGGGVILLCGPSYFERQKTLIT